MIFTSLFCIAINLRHLLDVEVDCVQNNKVVEDINHTHSCDGDIWIIKDSVRVAEKRAVWQSVYRLVRGLLVIVMPVSLVLIFNFGMVIGLVRRRLFNTAATTRTRDQAYSTIYITLAISFTAVSTAMPTVIHAAFFAKNIKNCHGPFKEEVLRASACLLLVGEHLTHFLFLAISQTFRVEIRTLLHDTKTCLNTTLARLTKNCSTCLCLIPFPSSSSLPSPAAHPRAEVSDAPASTAVCPHKPQVPEIVVEKLEEQQDSKASAEEDNAALKHASSSFVVSDADLDGLGKEMLRKISYMSETSQSSARTSTVTLEDEEQI